MKLKSDFDMQGSSSEPIGTDDRWGELWVSNLTAQVGWMPAFDGYNYWVDNMPLEIGTNQLVAAIRDQAGNTVIASTTQNRIVIVNPFTGQPIHVLWNKGEWEVFCP